MFAVFRLSPPPVFFAHGADDARCPPAAVRRAADRLAADVGAAVDRREYPGLAHQISHDVLRDAAAFVAARLAP